MGSGLSVQQLVGAQSSQALHGCSRLQVSAIAPCSIGDVLHCVEGEVAGYSGLEYLGLGGNFVE